MVWMKFQGKLEFREDLPVSEIERITDPINGHVLVLHCRNSNTIITINDETLCVWKDRESCYFYRDDGEWNPMSEILIDPMMALFNEVDRYDPSSSIPTEIPHDKGESDV